jgi:MYXO-CTERM domain-containing protein
MTIHKMKLVTGGVGALLLCAAFGARAQDNAVGPAQLKDFRLRGQTIVPAQPQPAAPQPVTVAPPPPVTAQPAPQAQTRQARPAPATVAPQPQPPAAQPSAPAAQQAPAPDVPAPEATPAPQPIEPGPVAEAPPVEENGGFPWRYAIPAGLALALLGLFLLRRRRRAEEDAYEPELVPAVPVEPSPFARRVAPPRPEPSPRPWLELGLKAERASATLTETVVMFELEIANTGKAAARNLRIDVKMFNAGAEQDKEIGAFFRTAGRETTKCHLPGIAAGTTGVIHAQVTMNRDDMRAVRLDDKLLFIPVIAVNALYDWGDGESGQTSRSWVVGRELETPSEKMGAFRVDLGPRVWRTVGQRRHKLARQV